ncbi:G/U mismatch-specific DNA glycosylase [bacterium]|nr:G/U mismatch-specific DNA glycosylase [bacterium]
MQSVERKSGGFVKSRRPTVAEVKEAAGKKVRDVLAPDLNVLFCGINPGLYSAAVGFHFARPGNRFWRALYDSGFTDRVLEPSEQSLLPEYGYGITNLVGRATVVAAALSLDELRRGRGNLKRKVRKYRPQFVAVLGIGAYRTAFDAPKAVLGGQDTTIDDTSIWVLPNPSGLNARYQPPLLAELFRELCQEATLSQKP